MRANETVSIHFNKLVRDKIPEIIQSEGRSVEIRNLSEQEALKYLNEKLCEEVKEFLDSQSVEELADIAEVLRALASAIGSTVSDVERIREEKQLRNGGFGKRILLLSAETPVR